MNRDSKELNKAFFQFFRNMATNIERVKIIKKNTPKKFSKELDKRGEKL